MRAQHPDRRADADQGRIGRAGIPDDSGSGTGAAERLHLPDQDAAASEVREGTGIGSGEAAHPVEEGARVELPVDGAILGAPLRSERDAFGRLRKITNQSDTLVAEYTYNGLNYRIGWHYDVDIDGDVDGNDGWESITFDGGGSEVIDTGRSLTATGIGSIGHNNIEWIEVITADGRVDRKHLSPGDPPEASFAPDAAGVTARQVADRGWWPPYQEPMPKVMLRYPGARSKPVPTLSTNNHRSSTPTSSPPV